jgi:hypothetical protein
MRELLPMQLRFVISTTPQAQSRRKILKLGGLNRGPAARESRGVPLRENFLNFNSLEHVFLHLGVRFTSSFTIKYYDHKQHHFDISSLSIIIIIIKTLFRHGITHQDLQIYIN